MPNYITTAQVAEERGVHVRTVHRWVATGRLVPVMKVPGQTGAYLFDPADLASLTAEEPKAS